MFLSGFEEGVRFPLQGFESEMPIGLGILLGEDANVHILAIPGS